MQNWAEGIHNVKDEVNKIKKRQQFCLFENIFEY